MVKVLKTKKKKATSKTQSLTIDNSEIISGKQKSKSKNRKTKRNRRNSGSDINNVRVSAEPLPVQKVSDSTLNSLWGLIGAKIMDEKNSLNTLEDTFAVSDSVDNMQMQE